MAYDDLRSLLRALEKEGDLKRVKAEVDPHLEVGEIVDRVQKAGGPALLFENVRGSSMPLAMNVYGTDRRLHSEEAEVIARVEGRDPDRLEVRNDRDHLDRGQHQPGQADRLMDVPP